jgi:hypothetical protein
MCPMCITTAVLSAAGASSGAGVIAVAASRWRALKRWFCTPLGRAHCPAALKSALSASHLLLRANGVAFRPLRPADSRDSFRQTHG